MEHSTLCLDLSSDDEDIKKASEDRGKENTPPAGYEVPVGSRRDSVAAPQPRRKVLKQDEMDDGERSPLCSLIAEDFYPEGLHKDSIVVITVTSTKEEENEDEQKKPSSRPQMYALPKKHLEEVEKGDVVDVPVVNGQGDFAGDIIIFEDAQDENAVSASSSSTKVTAGEKRKRGVSPVEDGEN